MRVAHVGLVGLAFVFACCTPTLNSEYVGDTNNPKAGAVNHLPMAILAADFHFEILGCHVAGGEIYFNNELKNVDIRRTWSQARSKN